MITLYVVDHKKCIIMCDERIASESDAISK